MPWIGTRQPTVAERLQQQRALSAAKKAQDDDDDLGMGLGIGQLGLGAAGLLSSIFFPPAAPVIAGLGLGLQGAQTGVAQQKGSSFQPTVLPGTEAPLGSWATPKTPTYRPTNIRGMEGTPGSTLPSAAPQAGIDPMAIQALINQLIQQQTRPLQGLYR